MGLSDEERFSGLCETLKELTNIGMDLEGKGSDSLMCKYLSQIWPAMLSNSSNGLFWIMGSTVGGSEYVEPRPGALFATAIYNNFCDHQVQCGVKDEDDLPPWEKRKNKSYEEKTEREKLFDYVCDFRPSISTVLQDSQTYMCGMGEMSSATYVKIFILVESAFYRINRYRDELSDRFIKIRELLAKIFGLCYKVFSTNEDYLAAFFLHHLSEKVLTYDEDVVNQIFMNNNLHHDWRVPNYSHRSPSLKDLFEMFKAVQGRNKLPLEERLVIILRVCGNRFHYKHQHKDVIKALEIHNKVKGAEKISVKNIQKALDQYCQEIKKEDNSLHRYCWVTGQSEDDLKEEPPKSSSHLKSKQPKKSSKKGKKKSKK